MDFKCIEGSIEIHYRVHKGLRRESRLMSRRKREQGWLWGRIVIQLNRYLLVHFVWWALCCAVRNSKENIRHSFIPYGNLHYYEGEEMKKCVEWRTNETTDRAGARARGTSADGCWTGVGRDPGSMCGHEPWTQPGRRGRMPVNAEKS